MRFTLVENTLDLSEIHKSKSEGAKSGDCVDQADGPPFAAHLLRGLLFEEVSTGFA